MPDHHPRAPKTPDHHHPTATRQPDRPELDEAIAWRDRFITWQTDKMHGNACTEEQIQAMVRKALDMPHAFWTHAMPTRPAHLTHHPKFAGVCPRHQLRAAARNGTSSGAAFRAASTLVAGPPTGIRSGECVSSSAWATAPATSWTVTGAERNPCT
jgi:hypothetical protein